MTARVKALAGAMSAAVTVAALIASCARPTTPTAGSVNGRGLTANEAPAVSARPAPAKPSPASETRAVPPCRTQGQGFELSLVEGFRGAPDPIAAARWFVRRGGVPGFGTITSVWTLPDPGQVARGAATVVDGPVSLQAIRLPNRTWAIISGARCG